MASIQRSIYPSLLLSAVALSGCTSVPPRPADTNGVIHENNEGYSLLYKLMSDESQVGKLFYIKHADKSISAPVKEIGLACDAAKKGLEEFRKTDPRLEFNEHDLPWIEQRSRNLQASDDRHALLFTSGEKFERRLIFTQAQAMNYGTQLCRALAEKETDLRRIAFLKDLQQQCAAFHGRLMELLKINS